MKAIAMNQTFTPASNSGGSIYAGNLLFGGMGLKSTQEKIERQQQTAGEIEFWESQKENLKNRECGTVEEIAEKLEALHTYEDEIKEAVMAYNHEQMFHTMDEARELGEKIAEAAEELEPKTPEERKEEAAKEAAGVEEDEGILSEILDEMLETVEDITEDMTQELTEDLTEDMTQELTEDLAEDMTQELTEELTEDMSQELEKEAAEQLSQEAVADLSQQSFEQQVSKYIPIDIRI